MEDGGWYYLYMSKTAVVRLVVIAVALVFFGAYWYEDEIKGYPAPWEGPRNYAPADFVWKASNAPDYEETMQKQTLALAVRLSARGAQAGGKTYRVSGEYLGCNPGASTPAAGELSHLTCWFGGGGDEFAVVMEGDKYFLTHRWIQESGGPDVGAAPEGPWEKVFEIR